MKNQDKKNSQKSNPNSANQGKDTKPDSKTTPDSQSKASRQNSK